MHLSQIWTVSRATETGQTTQRSSEADSTNLLLQIGDLIQRQKPHTHRQGSMRPMSTTSRSGPLLAVERRRYSRPARPSQLPFQDVPACFHQRRRQDSHMLMGNPPCRSQHRSGTPVHPVIDGDLAPDGAAPGTQLNRRMNSRALASCPDGYAIIISPALCLRQVDSEQRRSLRSRLDNTMMPARN